MVEPTLDRAPSALWRIAAGLAMAATLLVDGVLLWAVMSYAISGRPLTAGDWVLSGVLAAAMIGAVVVLLRLIRRLRPSWLGLMVVLAGLGLPGGLALLLALSGPAIGS